MSHTVLRGYKKSTEQSQGPEVTVDSVIDPQLHANGIVWCAMQASPRAEGLDKVTVFGNSISICQGIP